MDDLRIKNQLAGYRTVKINGIRFIIRKINPFLDFPSDQMPSLFTDFVTRRKPDISPSYPERDPRRILDEMKRVVQAALVEPELVPEERRNEGVTINDIFRNLDTGSKLYAEIIAHSLNRLQGIKGLFFSIVTRPLWFIRWRAHTGNSRPRSSIETGTSA